MLFSEFKHKVFKNIMISYIYIHIYIYIYRYQIFNDFNTQIFGKERKFPVLLSMLENDNSCTLLEGAKLLCIGLYA
jgi:hypothetical protein